jgi:hypothetical protein
MCLQSSSHLLFSYLYRLESRGLSKQYTEKIDEYIGKYLRVFKKISSQSAETFPHRSVHLMPRTRAKDSAYLKRFLGYYGIQFVGTLYHPDLPIVRSNSYLNQIDNGVKTTTYHG